jgi:hypothetical protein
MKPFHDIESLRHVIESVRLNCEYHGLEQRPVVKFRGTVKLHGTNGGVRVNGMQVVAQGRNRELTIDSDNYGFAHFVAGREGDFKMLATIINQSLTDEVTLYGEWCGSGIQSKVAIATLPHKMFVVFAVYNHTQDIWVDNWLGHNVGPEELAHLNSKHIYLINQAQTFDVEVDFNDPTPAAELISQYTLQVEDNCPFSAALHDAHGTGEGIVWVSYGYHERLRFKSKGEKHKKGGPKTHVAVDPEKVSAISDLVDLILPEWRLEQGFSFLRENNIPLANTSTGAYLKWVATDILKEESDRIAANPYPWKEIQGTVMTRAKKYYFEQLNEMAGLPSASELAV